MMLKDERFYPSFKLHPLYVRMLAELDMLKEPSYRGSDDGDGGEEKRITPFHTPQAPRTTLGSVLLFFSSSFLQSLLMDLRLEALIWYLFPWLLWFSYSLMRFLFFVCVICSLWFILVFGWPHECHHRRVSAASGFYLWYWYVNITKPDYDLKEF